MLRARRGAHRGQHCPAPARHLRAARLYAGAVRARARAGSLERAGVQHAAALPVPVLCRAHARAGRAGGGERRPREARYRQSATPRAAAIPCRNRRGRRTGHRAAAGPAAPDFRHRVRRADGRGRQRHRLLPPLAGGAAVLYRLAGRARGRGLAVARRRIRCERGCGDAGRPAAAAGGPHRPARQGPGWRPRGARLQDPAGQPPAPQGRRCRGRLPATVLRPAARRCGGGKLGLAGRREARRQG
ncbi:hypothetical protein D3C81_1252660 [compost metagenome]